DYRAYLRGEITLRTTTLSTDDLPPPDDSETAWHSVNGEGDGLTAQLLREIAEDSPLTGAQLTPVLRRFDRDDVIFRVEAGAKKTGYARIHLTYGDRRRKYARLPRLFPTPEAATGA
ncbi:MAG: hypothetical protein H7Y38_10600, partial [Armatimonadetes bacterium]|nr:hypothetical protein [Armatimonadota bacterium]